MDTSIDLTVCFITTQTQWHEPTDILLTPGNRNGIKTQSLVRTSKIATLHRTLAKGLLGELSPIEMTALNNKLKTLFQIP